MTASTPALPHVTERGVLAGSSVLVAGAGPAGIATARAFAASGAWVALAGMDDLALLRTARIIERSGGRAIPLPGDLRDPDVMSRVVAGARETYGGLDFAVNTMGALDGPRSATDGACRGVYLAMRSELRAIVATGGGAIVNAAPTPTGRHAEDAQCIIGLSRAAALDYADYGVGVNAVIAGSGDAGDFAAAALRLCAGTT
jgi:NAD(P)-dependent dehydrogenase (short-subunit alcohol dehydrogenase family)